MARVIRWGEVRWCAFREPDKRRPVVILTRDSVLAYLNEVTVAPITTTVRDIPSEVLLTEEDGLPKPCAINADHLQTVSKSRITTLITRLNASKMDDLRLAIEFALGLR